jgi:hypothetical protein
MREAFLRRLLSTIKCSVCSRNYEAKNVNVLGHQGELWFISVFCPACGTQGLVAAVVKEGTPTEVITDLTEEELAEFALGEAVGIDDVLDIHNLLKDFEGDVSNLFTEK